MWDYDMNDKKEDKNEFNGNNLNLEEFYLW